MKKTWKTVCANVFKQKHIGNEENIEDMMYFVLLLQIRPLTSSYKPCRSSRNRDALWDRGG